MRTLLSYPEDGSWKLEAAALSTTLVTAYRNTVTAVRNLKSGVGILV
jgi:hypothetical protein